MTGRLSVRWFPESETVGFVSVQLLFDSDCPEPGFNGPPSEPLSNTSQNAPYSKPISQVGPLSHKLAEM